MGLYLCVFESDLTDDEVDGVEIGSYADFDAFRSKITTSLERGKFGSRFPTLLVHPDADGEWTPADASELLCELEVIAKELGSLPPTELEPGSWQHQLARGRGLQPASLAECFFDIDGVSLLDRIAGLAATAVELGRPISFQ